MNNSAKIQSTESNQILKKKSIIKKYWSNRFLFALMLPGLIAMLIFQYVPIYGLVIIFKDYKLSEGIFAGKWVGLKNILEIFRLPGVWRAVANSFIISIYSFAVGFPLGILFALLLNEIRAKKLKSMFQSISYLPHFLSWIIVAALLIDILSPSRGPIGLLINMFGGKPVHFLIEPKYFRSIIVFSGIWKTIGWNSIIYLAAISGTSIELYDAAIVDGAGRFKQAMHITLPAMYPVITITLILSLSGLMGGDFEQIFNLVNSRTLPVGDVISTYVYRIGLQEFQYSFSAAVGLLSTFVGVTLLFIANKIAAYFSDYTIW